MITCWSDLHLYLQRIEAITAWQAKFYLAQVLIINSMFVVILLTLFCLVTISTTFNYESNILGPLWFNIMVVLCLLSGSVRKLFRSKCCLFLKLMAFA